MRRPPLRLIAACAVVLGCVESPLARDNPLDSGSGATLRFTTVDTAFSHFEVITFAPTISRGYVPEGAPRIDYRALGPDATVFRSSGPLGFTVQPQATVYPVTVPIEANLLDRLKDTVSVVVMQRLRQVSITCAFAPCGTLGVGAARSLAIALRDSLGFPLNIPGNPSAYSTAQARDTTIAKATGAIPGVIQLTGRTPGSTWLVVGNNQMWDSIAVVVTPP